MIVWVCPACGNYYGASSEAGVDLRTVMNRDAKGRETFSRARCPDCADRRMTSERQPVEVTPITVGEVLARGDIP